MEIKIIKGNYVRKCVFLGSWCVLGGCGNGGKKTLKKVGPPNKTKAHKPNHIVGGEGVASTVLWAGVSFVHPTARTLGDIDSSC